MKLKNILMLFALLGGVVGFMLVIVAAYSAVLEYALTDLMTG